MMAKSSDSRKSRAQLLIDALGEARSHASVHLSANDGTRTKLAATNVSSPVTASRAHLATPNVFSAIEAARAQLTATNTSSAVTAARAHLATPNVSSAIEAARAQLTATNASSAVTAARAHLATPNVSSAIEAARAQLAATNVSSAVTAARAHLATPDVSSAIEAARAQLAVTNVSSAVTAARAHLATPNVSSAIEAARAQLTATNASSAVTASRAHLATPNVSSALEVARAQLAQAAHQNTGGETRKLRSLSYSDDTVPSKSAAESPKKAHSAVKFHKKSTALRRAIDGQQEAKKKPAQYRLTIKPKDALRNSPPYVSKDHSTSTEFLQSVAIPHPRSSPSQLAGPRSVASVSDLGEMVRRMRRERGMAQGELATLAGTGRRFISDFETGKPTLEFERMLKVCDVLGINLFATSRSNAS